MEQAERSVQEEGGETDEEIDEETMDEMEAQEEEQD